MIGIKMIPSIIPRSLTHQKSLRSLNSRPCIIAKINIGQNKIFICSQVDSFTLEKGAIKLASPNQSYKKCKSVPKTEVKINPKNCQSFIERFIVSPLK
jgi:hypothetical protein